MQHHLSKAGDQPGKGGRWEDPQSLLFLSARFLEHVRVRNYSPRTQRAYAFDLLAFGRWLETEGVALSEVDIDVLLRFLTACREAVLPGRPGGRSYSHQ